MGSKADSAEYWVKRFDRLEAHRRSFWDDNLQNVADYILPRKSNIVLKREKGADMNTYVFDSTAIFANELLASRMQSDLVPSSAQWFYLEADFPANDKEIYGEELEDNVDVKRFLDECAEKMDGRLDASNFNTVIHEFFLDLGCFNTACMSMQGVKGADGKFERFVFESIPIQSYVFAENADGEVDLVIRKIKKTARQAAQKWELKELHENIQKAVKDEPEKEFDFIHAVFPKEDFDPNTKKTKDNLPYGSLVIDLENKEIVEEEGYQEFPFFVCRWSKASGEKYGRGPGRTAIHDINILNTAKHLELRAWTKVIDPPVMVEHDTFMGNIRLTPNSLIHVKDITRPPMPFVTQTRWDINALKKDELIESIKRMFYSDQLQFPDQQDKDMTAREVVVRYEMMKSLFGSTFGRIVYELLSPLIERLWSKMFRVGMLPEPPAILGNVTDFKIKYKSPLALAQKIQDAQAIDSWLASMMPLYEVDPTIFDTVDLKKVAVCKADLLGVPAKVMRSNEEQKELAEKRAKAEEAQQEMEQTEREAKALGSMAPFMREAEDITQGETVNV